MMRTRATTSGPSARMGWLLGAALLSAAAVRMAAGPAASAFSFFASEVRLDQSDLERIGKGGVITRTLDGEGKEVVVFAAGALTVSIDEYVERIDDVENLWQGPYVPQIGRFSDPPRVEDLAELTLDESDLRDIADCRPSDCGIKLSPVEIPRFQSPAREDGEARASAVELELKRAIVERVNAYRQRGRSGLPQYGGPDEPVEVGNVLASVLERSTSLQEQAPEIVTYLRRYPEAPAGDFASLFYWAKQDFGYKPVIVAFHVVRMEREADGARMVVTVSKQLFATHYFDGAVAVSVYSLEPGSDRRGHLGYLHRTVVDLPLMWLLRPFVERGATSKGREVFALMLERIERDGARDP